MGGDGDELDTENLRFEIDSSSKKKYKSVLADGWAVYAQRSFSAIFLTSKLNILLPCIPMAMISKNTLSDNGGAGIGGDGWTFTFSLLGIAPLAERLGFVTEELAEYTNQTLGGLLNASFGNLTEMIVSMFALRNNMLRVVKLSLLGSILSNTLLVLGCAFFFGGMKYKEQTFNADGANCNTGLLCLAVMGMTVPATLHATHTEMSGTGSEVALSRICSVFLLITYLAYLYFQLITHRELFEDDDDDDDDSNEGDEEDEEEKMIGEGLGFWGCVGWLGVLTIFISMLSDYLVDAIEGAAASWDMSVAFISVIVIPIVGNAAEHASAVIFAMKNKMDISIGVAIGSSTQIALLVFPFMVMVGYVCGKDMDLNLKVFESATLFMSVLTVAFMVADGQSTWLKGLTLILAYLVLSCSFWFHRDDDLKAQWPGAHA
uniref:Vacuolar cation/proton exchanger n=1 Tax=Pyramimonas obovata TaxID=1411642 RepID=A0A7S0WVJ7_9CHLO|mmetsp:Transcript_5710/g.11650  ORF Transcript_5710/g.11650 Transcript_5710/m.11650 type:complete len:432 (+) Transcript_5710:132-1427(+)|eukprot:CAMPEP_0118924426 /NCGR_PEP_ID=MMETSP1169-20130426/2568_1 /TAXON_ID=36882 /ORGANISM="Pyramimonas obovata, Strain CCMP722" /LENGTH=431 /DNA_ID=CAMNT_0006865541 /DNA_START=132 /DNA_END=1427 /DNA_ORIENTATION=+